MLLLSLMKDFLNENPWLNQLAVIILAFMVAWIVHRLDGFLAKYLLHLTHFTPGRYQIRQERRKTLQDLIASAITFLAFAIALMLSLSLFVSGETLIWMVGLFSAAFGLGARPLISDFLAGIGFLFEDTFDVGEKVEILGVEGVIEQVNLRTTFIRAPSGELYVVPNGEVRVVRNFSRGRFSTANITLKVATADLNRALLLLEELGQEAVLLLPNLLEPWQVISQTGLIGQQTELTLVTKARFGRAAEMRPRLLALLQERLEEAGITLVD